VNIASVCPHLENAMGWLAAGCGNNSAFILERSSTLRVSCCLRASAAERATLISPEKMDFLEFGSADLIFASTDEVTSDTGLLQTCSMHVKVTANVQLVQTTQSRLDGLYEHD
jgi:hypothetical protein